MHSVKRRSHSNPTVIARKSLFDREDKSLTRNDQRKTQTLKLRTSQTNESSHIPRPRVRSSSSDRAGSLGRKSYLKVAGKTPLRQTAVAATPITPSTSIKYNLLGLTASASRSCASLRIGRSPSNDRVSNVGATKVRKDTRPLMDKTYQISLLNKIDNFFCTSQRSTMLNNNGSLKPITLKMFVEVSGLLLKSLDVKQELTMANYVEELPKCAKKLHYPGVMTKSWLKTANAMHSWPYVLGWIGWLVEVCQVREIAFDRYQLETFPFVGTEQEAYRQKMELLTLFDCYKAWNDEKHEEETALVEKYMQNILIEQGVTDDDIARAREKAQEENIKLQIHEKESLEFEEQILHLQAKLSSLHAKQEKQINDIKLKERHIKHVTTETNQLKAECKVLNEKIQIGNIQQEELISIVRNQPMSNVEKKQIVKKCTEIQNYIYEFDEHLKDYQKELYILDIKLASFNNNINKVVLAYNKELFMHIDNDVSVNFDDLKLPEKRLLDPQIMNVLEEIAASTKIFKEKLIQQCNETESIIRSDTMKLEKLQEEIKSLPDEDKLKEEISHINEMKEDVKKEKAKLMKQIDILKNEIKEMQDMMPDIKAVDLEIKEAKDKLDAVIRRKTFLEQSAKRFFDEFYKILGEHRSELYDMLTKHKK